jgi:Fibronectin type III domain
MRRVMGRVVLGLTTVTLLAATATGAYASVPAATTAACPAILAPAGMNPLPANDDCPTPGARTTKVQTLVTPHAASTPISMTPLSFDRTNGDLLAITKVDGTNDLAFGGNFSLVYTPDGVSHSATNFAVVDEASGTVLYGGSAGGGTDKYVRSLGSLNGVIYIGGDFTSWGGVSRSHAVSLAPTGDPASPYSVTAWNPAPSDKIRGLAVDSSAVYFGSGDSARAVNLTTGATIWSKGTSGGSVASVFKDQGNLFVGGLFNNYDGVAHPGLVKVNPSNGSLIAAFDAHMRPNTGQGQYGAYDGEEIITMAPGPNAGEFVAGGGGHAPAGLSSNEAFLLDINTGARLMHYSTLGDGQAVGAVGNTTVAGYHNNTGSAGDPTSANYFGIQLENTTVGTPTTWDPRVNGNQLNADGGNNGVQAMYVDQTTQTLYLGGAFLHWNGTTGSNHQSLIAFSFATGSPTAPNAPTNVTASPGNAQATVSWTAPSNGGSTITGYTVTSSPDGVTATTSGATSVVVPGLTNGVSYTFTVTATNAIDTSDPSDPSNSVMPEAPTAPDAPTNVTASPGNASASVSWTAPVNNGGSPITGYAVTSNPAGGTGSTLGAASTTVTGLSNGVSYTFTVTATNGAGTSDPSDPSNSVMPEAPTAPDAPTNVTASPGNASASVSWTAPVNNGGSPITGYAVTSNPAGGTGSTLGAASTTVTGLSNGVSYTFTVTATNGAGTSDPSDPSNSVTPTGFSGKSNTAEGGTAGVSVTTGNSGGASGNAFTVVSRGSGATLIYSAAAAAHGAWGYSIKGSSGTATFVGWNGYSATSMAIRFYYNPGPTLPSKVMRLADIRNSTATASRVELSASNQLFIQNAAGTTVTTFPHALQANTWYRIELTISISSSAAAINAAYYPADSTTPVDPAYSTITGNTGTANITQVSIGSAANATWTGTSYFDDLAAQAGSTAFIGPG